MVGDIIVIENYTHEGQNLSKHSFVIMDDEVGQIRGLDYDIICNVMSSFKNKEQKIKKLRYLGNFPLVSDDFEVIEGNGKSGYIKTDQLYYFNKNKIEYIVIGSLKEEIIQLLRDFIEEELEQFEILVDNL